MTLTEADAPRAKIEDERVAACVDRWHRYLTEGSPATAEDVCVDRPELVPHVDARLRSLRAKASSAAGWFTGYDVLSVLGEGGMGRVYLARDRNLPRRVAIKVVLPDRITSEALARFQREAEEVARLDSHPHIIGVLHVGRTAGAPPRFWRRAGGTGGLPYIVMPIRSGETLAARLKRESRPPLGLTLKVGAELAEGLAAAHAAGVVHRDVKPGNVWITGDPDSRNPEEQALRCKLFDFGIAHKRMAEQPITVEGAAIGTPEYMSPEQWGGADVDGRADLFSLGVVLYQMTTGRSPFRRPNHMEILHAIACHEPPAPRQLSAPVPEALSDLIERLMSKRRDDRPRSAAEVADAVRRVADKERRKARHSFLELPSRSTQFDLLPLRPAPAGEAATTTPRTPSLEAAETLSTPPRPARPDWAWRQFVLVLALSALSTATLIWWLLWPRG